VPKFSSSGNGSACSLTQHYSLEADLVRHQTGLLVQLMQPALPEPAIESHTAIGSQQQWASADLESAKLLLCVQVVLATRA
jgi:hypothetical protein